MDDMERRVFVVLDPRQKSQRAPSILATLTQHKQIDNAKRDGLSVSTVPSFPLPSADSTPSIARQQFDAMEMMVVRGVGENVMDCRSFQYQRDRREQRRRVRDKEPRPQLVAFVKGIKSTPKSTSSLFSSPEVLPCAMTRQTVE